MSPDHPHIQDEDFEPILDPTEVDWSEVAGQYPELAGWLGEIPDSKIEISNTTVILVWTNVDEGGIVSRTIARCDECSGETDENGDPVAEGVCAITIGPDESVTVLSRWGGYNRSEQSFHPGDADAAMKLATGFFEQVARIRVQSPEKFIPASQE